MWGAMRDGLGSSGRPLFDTYVAYAINCLF